MKIFGNKYVRCLCLVLLCAALSAGCIAPSKTVQDKTLITATPEETRSTVPVTTAPQSSFGNQLNMATVALDYGVTISYPPDWRVEEGSGTVLRDYGRNVINIANFYSPAINADRAFAAAPNPDKSGYTILSIDIDPEAAPDFERYFNMATLAVGRQYEDLEITKRNVVLRLSITDTFPAGYKSYELDFDAKDMRGKYIFTNVDGTVYIFAFRNPSPYSKEVEDIYKSVVIVP
jgi:hypothetical protein